MDDTGLRRFPGADRLLVHVAAGRGGRHVRSLTGSSDWRRELADLGGAAVIAACGADSLRVANRWAWPTCSATDLVDALRVELPGLRLVGAATPRQHGRQRLSLLGRSGGTLTVIKLGSGAHATDGLGSDAGSLTTEAAALGLLEADPLPGIATPRVLAAGVVTCPHSSSSSQAEHIEFVATTSIALGSQRPAFDAPLRTFGADLAERLTALSKPADGDADAVPVHGDLTPWNLRRTRRGLALFDWESAGWGKPGSDLATYRQACDDIRAAVPLRPRWSDRSRPTQWTRP